MTGTATGGVDHFACAEGSNVHLIDYLGGDLLTVFLGDDRNNIAEVKRGHTAVITCLLHDGDFVFSGGADDVIICWDARLKLKKDLNASSKVGYDNL